MLITLMAFMTKPKKTTSRDWVTVDEAAEVVGARRETVIRMIRRGELRAFKQTLGLTAPYRIYKDSLDEFLKKRETINRPK
ncbi:MAG TPA: helix-turn-helix domain-containing protein [Anaerolineae bacterium]|nr:helix-turn-helix domain-containing protein [Anaerolineae bacterium]